MIMNSCLLNPLSSLHWEFSSCWPGGNIPVQAVFLHDRIYVGSPHTRRSRKFGMICYASAVDEYMKWPWQYHEITEPDVHRFGLGVYQSRLVLVGGVKASGEFVNDVWFSDDGSHWHQSKAVPPLPIVCGAPGVVNTGDPEYLIVAGGYTPRSEADDVDADTATDKVFVLIEDQWLSLQPLTVPCSFVRCTYYSGNVYLSSYGICVYCRMTALLSACDSARMGNSNEASFVWKTIKVPDRTLCIVSFGQQLLAIRCTIPCDGLRVQVAEYGMFVHRPLSDHESWVHVGNLHRGVNPKCVVALPPQHMLLLGVIEHVVHGPGNRFRAFTATLRVPAYDPDSQFSMSSLSRLEAAGIEVLTSLTEKQSQLALAIKMAQPVSQLQEVLDHWQRSSKDSSSPPTTWRSLYQVLGKLGLQDLSQQIENYLSSPRSLKEQCMSVITAALLEQRSLEPDQLHVRLPPYVPPTVKRSIVRHFEGFTN